MTMKSFIKTKKLMLQRWTRDRVLLGLVSPSFLLFLIGTTWGFPFIYHPDEPVIVRDAVGVSQFDLKLEHFDWPHLQTYLDAFSFKVLIKGRGLLRLLGLETTSKNLFPLLWNDENIFYFLGRLWSVLWASLTVGLVYLTGRTLRSKPVGILAALLLMLNVAVLDNARLATIDTPMVFWVTLSLFFAIRIVRNGLEC